MSTTFARTLLGATLLVGACGSNPPPAAIRDIRLNNVPVGPSGVPEVASGSQFSITVMTEGICNSVRVHWGDDDPWESVVPPYVVTSNIYGYPGGHTYPSDDALHGYKSVTATGDGSTCIGEVKKRFLVTPQLMATGWALAASACDDAKPFMQTTLGNVVYLVDIPPPVPGPTRPVVGQIVVGPNQVYDANGAAEVADASFPFPGWLKYSVIVMVVAPDLPGPPQLFQGGTSFSFRVAQPGSKIRLCYNSDRMPPDPIVQQGFQVNFRADASNAVLPP